MSLQTQLELFLPTYNRKQCLAHTLAQLTAPESPVRNCRITILNNASTDGTKELLQKYAARFANINVIHHSKNIGGNANIVRCFELATAPFMWVVCDDDSFDWKHWHEIEKALLSDQYDILLTHKHFLKGTSDIAKIIRQLTFLPAGIYRTRYITAGVLINMFNNIPNLLPHMALICEIINKKGIIFVPEGEIIAQTGIEIASPLKGVDQKTYTPQSAREMFWVVGFFNSLQLLQDEKLRTYVKNNLGRHGFFGYLMGAFRLNYTRYGSSQINVRLMINNMNLWQRFQFFWVRVFLQIINFFRKKNNF
ncbi:MAG: glycosyltransferase family 2 protein [Elusimicrobiaceae bacterium]|nr:glycosyltransferase family 2 protein [Elusimicrobiaceae bacterium]